MTDTNPLRLEITDVGLGERRGAAPSGAGFRSPDGAGSPPHPCRSAQQPAHWPPPGVRRRVAAGCSGHGPAAAGEADGDRSRARLVTRAPKRSSSWGSRRSGVHLAASATGRAVTARTVVPSGGRSPRRRAGPGRTGSRRTAPDPSWPFLWSPSWSWFGRRVRGRPGLGRASHHASHAACRTSSPFGSHHPGG